jgi:hypothetical protein
MFTDYGEDSNANTSIELDNVQISNGGHVVRLSRFRGIFSLRNSTISNMFQGNLFQYPSGNVIIAQNVFQDVGKFDFYEPTDGATMITVNNRFIRKSTFSNDGEYHIGVTISSQHSCNAFSRVALNSFLSDGFAVAASNSGSCETPMSAVNNYWGTTEESEIAKKIKDKNTDIGLLFEIPFKPFLTEPHPDTP